MRKVTGVGGKSGGKTAISTERSRLFLMSPALLCVHSQEAWELVIERVRCSICVTDGPSGAGGVREPSSYLAFWGTRAVDGFPDRGYRVRLAKTSSVQMGATNWMPRA